jgi:hypothetical protein
MDIKLQALRAKVRGFHAAGETLRCWIGKAKGPAKSKLWYEKRQLGVYNRYNLIAYGLLRGIPYENIERCSNNNKPDPREVLKVVLEHASWEQRKQFDLAKIEALLTVTSSKPVQPKRPRSVFRQPEHTSTLKPGPQAAPQKST